MLDVLIVLGTRPEVIKLVPVYRALVAQGFSVKLCNTGQQREMTLQALAEFDVSCHYNLDIMRECQGLLDITRAIFAKLSTVIDNHPCRYLVIQGDTSSAVAAALVAFFYRIPVAHVEAGLRTGDRYNPYPEEINRRLLSVLSTIHFAPTPHAKQNLLYDGVKDNIYVTGNTVLDSLKNIFEQSRTDTSLIDDLKTEQRRGTRLILLTIHRRETVTSGDLQQIFAACRCLLEQAQPCMICFPMHPNPAIREAFEKQDWPEAMHVLPPLGYRDFVFLLDTADLVITDSGGVLEEAVYLNTPTLIARRRLDRPEALGIARAWLVGTGTQNIVRMAMSVLDLGQTAEGTHEIGTPGHSSLRCHAGCHNMEHQPSGTQVCPGKPGPSISTGACVFGDGRAAERIAKILRSYIYSTDPHYQKNVGRAD